MKQLIFILLSISVSFTVSAQKNTKKIDTLSVLQLGNGYSKVVTKSRKDTTISVYFLNGQLESVRPTKNGLYSRYYPNGDLMWTQELRNGLANGLMNFYNKVGQKIGSLELKNDTIVDTLFINEDQPFVFGRFTYSSEMHGGMRPADGSSNISKSEGSKMLTKMYLVRHNKEKSAEKYAEFTTDMNGYFFFPVEKGSYGVFPHHYKLEEVLSHMGTPPNRSGSSVTTTWNITKPILIDQNFRYLPIHVHSIGYAP